MKASKTIAKHSAVLTVSSWIKICWAITKTDQEYSPIFFQVEVVYTNRSEAAVLAEEAAKKQPAPQVDDEEDLDIDDI